MFYFWLFYINAFISAFTFGGGYVVIPMIEKYFVDKKALFTKADVMEMAAVAQSVPGAIAVNLAVLAGYRTKGFRGAFISCLGSLLPPLLLISGLSLCYDTFIANQTVRLLLKGMEAGAVALVIDLLLTMTTTLYKEQEKTLFCLIPAVFIAVFFLEFSVIGIILCSLLYCVLFARKRRLS